MLIYDGDCAFCTSSATWIEKRIPTGYPVVPWQHLPALNELGLTAADVERSAWWLDADGTAYDEHRSIGRALITAGGFWSLVGWLIVLPPICWLAAPVYRLVARNRHRLPGGTPACAVRPPAEQIRG